MAILLCDIKLYPVRPHQQGDLTVLWYETHIHYNVADGAPFSPSHQAKAEIACIITYRRPGVKYKDKWAAKTSGLEEAALSWIKVRSYMYCHTITTYIAIYDTLIF
jgi:hypothetical protein